MPKINYSEQFEQKVWKRYPKRNGQRQGKAPAFKEWEKLNQDQKLHVIDQIDKRNRYNGWGKYIKDCQRWLKDHADDEFEVPKTYAQPMQVAEKEGPMQECPGKRAFNRVWFSWMGAEYLKWIGGGGRKATDADIQEMLKIRDRFAETLLIAWKAKESLVGLDKAFLVEIEGVLE